MAVDYVSEDGVVDSVIGIPVPQSGIDKKESAGRLKELSGQR